MVFTDVEKQSLVQYILAVTKMQYGLTKKVVSLHSNFKLQTRRNTHKTGIRSILLERNL
jgi:hypothetical protein